MQTTPSRRELEDILHFYAEAGLDFAQADAPIDQFTAFEAQKSAAKTTIPAVPLVQPTQSERRAAPPAARAAAIPDDAAIAAAQRLAQGCASIAELAAALESFEGCGLKFTAKHLVFADGNPGAPVMFVTDVPGREDDLEGRLFAGPSGLLFDRMLASIGLDRRSTYLAAMIAWRPPGNRMPTAFEIDVCRPFIQRHLQLASPKLVVLVGDLPAKTLIRSNDSILRLRGQWRELDLGSGRTAPALSMLHPAYLMKQPAQKRLAWADLLALKGRLN